MNTTTSYSHPRLRKGLSLIELTVMIAVMIALMSILFVGLRAYKASSDRAACVMNIHSIQNAVRSYSNINGYIPGDTAPDLRSDLVGPDGFLVQLPDCPAGGSYSDLGDRIPVHGELYLSCSLKNNERHLPQATHSW